MKNKKIWRLLILASIGVMLFPQLVMAAEVVTSKINMLNNLILDVVSFIGVGFLAWGIFSLASGMQSHDTQQQTASLPKIVGGIICMAAPQLIKIFQ